jgi:hypothetical protein
MTPNTTQDLLEQHIEDYGEWLEMFPGQEWEMLARILASKLATQKELTAFYKGLAYARKG